MNDRATRMQFGLLCTATSRRREDIDEYVDFCVHAEQRGFEASFLVEHHFSGWDQVSATLMLQTCVALRTSVLRLGTGVMVIPWHHPVLLAEQFATLDVLSGGRVDIGIGKGYRHSEFHGFNIAPSEADARFLEGLDLLQRAWTSRERFSFGGSYWRCSDIVVEPAPVQKPFPPIWIAAASEASVRRVSHLGHGLILDQYASPAEIDKRLGWFDADRVAVARQVFVAESRVEATEALRRQAAFTRRTIDVSRAPGGAGGAHVLAYNNPEEHAIFGTPDEVVSALQELKRLGVRYVLINFAGGREQLDRFGEITSDL